jgi:hypothetical protein
VVVAAALLGDAFAGPFTRLFGTGWPALLGGAAALFVLFRAAILAGTSAGRRRLAVRLERLYRYEFWPAWLFYLPLVPWLAWLAVRHRGALVWTAANPGIAHGGLAGESKWAILEQLPTAAVVPGILVPPGELSDRVALVCAALLERGWSFPLILKPDVGERGSGVRLARDGADVEKYLRQQPAAVIAQVYHPGPFEAGIFYYRLPGSPAGHILSLTDKVFPVVAGDGRSTLEELILAHPRYRLQAEVFLARHERERGRVLAEGETFRLAVAGNHCQGTLFRDGAHLITPELERAIDAVARAFDGFFIGRFDVRYSDVAAFRGGRDLAVVELNGVASESTNLYDPSWSLLSAYRVLFRQWALLYAIGAANRDRGHAPSSVRAVLAVVCEHLLGRRARLAAD